MNKTNISWADYTLNPLYKIISLELGMVAHGCNKKSLACVNCYSELMNMQQRFLGDGKPYKGITYADMMLDYKVLSRLQKNIKKPKSVFLCSMTDWAATSEFVRMEWAIDILQACANSKYTCYLLTKRAENLPEILRLWQIKHRVHAWPSNVWLGFTAENQEWFNKRWASFTDGDGVLSRFSDANVFVSYEPALGGLVLPISFTTKTKENVLIPSKSTKYLPRYEWSSERRWLIAGGESGNNARPPHPWDFIQIKNQCQKHGIGFHFKQWGTWRPVFEPIYYGLNTGTLPLEDGDMVKAPRDKGNDLLFGREYRWTPISK
jgi:protein gp37